MTMPIHRRLAFCLLTVAFSTSSGAASEGGLQGPDAVGGREYSPYINSDRKTLPDIKHDDGMRAYFGDTHVHTSWSTDAGMVGASLGPDVAYELAKGGQVTTDHGWQLKLVRPLDFVVVADHAENLGLADYIRRSDPLILANKTGKRWHDLTQSGDGYDAFLEWLRAGDTDLINEPAMAVDVWKKVADNADKYNEPGSFTAFHGFEWTSHPGGNNMHRVVIFRDDSSRTKQVVPYSQYDSVDAEDLWNYLGEYEEKTGGRVLAIPHNGNLSNGLMFDPEKTYSGKLLSASYTQTRARWEPVVEATQQKGDGETHPLLSPDDAFADFETMDAGNLNGTGAKSNDMLHKEYARSALKAGLQLEAKFGTNPYKFGMIGSSDNHTALATTREENNWSKAHILEPDAARYEHALIESPEDPALSIWAVDVGAAGLAGVWADENTRESIWDAMARKEVFATTGTRMQVRLFGGWNFGSGDATSKQFGTVGTAGGVPMGGDLRNPPEGKAPTFIVQAARDPDGANLDRVQMVKGWMDGSGVTHERIYDIAVSGDRKIDEAGVATEPVGNTVDLTGKMPSYTNTIGAPQLLAYWADPEFDPSQGAFYYVRVLEIPTPRWTAYDEAFFDVTMGEDVVRELQERAYTSPIWYTP